MIKLEALQLRQLAAAALRQLAVEDTVQVTEVHELDDGSWFVDFEDRSEDTRFPGFAVGIEPAWSADEAARALRIELREKLWICPLCQRRSRIRRIVDREVFRVECGRCGRFEIDSELLDHLRSGYEDNDSSVVDELPRLTALAGQAKTPLYLSSGNWRSGGQEQ
jgi:hypothetical protein